MENFPPDSKFVRQAFLIDEKILQKRHFLPFSSSYLTTHVSTIADRKKSKDIQMSSLDQTKTMNMSTDRGTPNKDFANVAESTFAHSASENRGFAYFAESTFSPYVSMNRDLNNVAGSTFAPYALNIPSAKPPAPRKSKALHKIWNQNFTEDGYEASDEHDSDQDDASNDERNSEGWIQIMTNAAMARGDSHKPGVATQIVKEARAMAAPRDERRSYGLQFDYTRIAMEAKEQLARLEGARGKIVPSVPGNPKVVLRSLWSGFMLEETLRICLGNLLM